MIRHAFVVVLAVATLTTACGLEDGSLFSRKPEKRARDANPRFVLLQGQRTLEDGRSAPIVLRMDAATGETWVLDGRQPAKWVSIEDNLRWGGTYDPKSKKLLWGVSLPGGRDLNDLSREELIRHLESAIRDRPPGDPNDPLGIREPSRPR